jgi:tetratricopeptide (TPR) repeat protein
MGRQGEADVLIEKAVRLPGTEAAQIYAYGVGILNEGKRDKAMEVFLLNKQQNPDKLFWISLGLARGYTALNDKQNAIANWQTLIQNVPDAFRGRLPRFQEALKKLQRSE